MIDPKTLEAGEIVTAPGVYLMPLDWYHDQSCDGPSASSSGLRTIFGASPAHYWISSSLNPDRIEEEPSEALILGRAAHHLFLGEREFSSIFVIRPDQAPDGRAWNGNNLTCKSWFADQKAAGLTVLKPEQVEQIKGMRAGLERHPLVQAGILDGAIEHSLIWRDEETGVWLKARPDAIPNASGDFADLKTTADVTPRGIQKAIDDGRLDMQAALVKWGAKAVLGIEMNEFSLVFVEKTPPHCVEIRTVRPDDIREAEEDLRAALRLFARCVKENHWPGPGGSRSDAAYISVSEFTRKRAADRRAFILQEIAA